MLLSELYKGNIISCWWKLLEEQMCGVKASSSILVHSTSFFIEHNKMFCYYY